MNPFNRKHISLNKDYGVLNPRSHSRVIWRVIANVDGTPYFRMYYRGADFADAADAFVEHCALPYVTLDLVWGQLVLEPELTALLRRIDDAIEAEDAHILESPS